MDIQVVPLRAFETAPGSITEPGVPLVVPQEVARRWVQSGNACYYADFSQSMLEEAKPEEEVTESRSKRQSRVVKPGSTAAETKAPGE
jgi:hypothetical protein